MKYNFILDRKRVTSVTIFYTAILFLADFFSIIIVDSTSLFSFGYALLILIVSSFFICRKEMNELLFSYLFLFLFAVSFFVLFKKQNPVFMGLTGVTDDGLYYYQLTGGRGISYYVRLLFADVHPFVFLLKTLYPFKIHTPLNIITINLIFGAYLPVFVKRLAILLTKDKRVGQTSFWLSLICPFILYYSCIIMRESIMALMVCAGLCYFLQKKYLPLIICASVISFVRLGNLPYLLCGILILYRYILKKKIKSDFIFLFLLIAIIGVFHYSMDLISELSDGRLEGNFIRKATFIGYDESTIAALMKYPFPLNIILSTSFFLYIPPLTIPHLEEAHSLVHTFFIGLFTPLFMLALWKYIFNAIIVAIYKHIECVQKILLIILLFAIILGTISLQFRHKTVLFPIMCILAAYGIVRYDNGYSKMTLLLTLFTFIIYIIPALN